MDINFRIGHGYDVHALAAGLPMIIGGVRIDSDRGCVAHSDGDVLAHALGDALLGAAALGDIGLHFPDTSPEYRGADSMRLLSEIVEMLREAGWRVINTDATIVLQQPRLRPYIDSMRENLARAMGVASGAVSVKATTEEHLGFTGNGEGIAAHAVVLIATV